MSGGPQFRIRDRLYPVPQNERLGEMRLIERVTGIPHREFRTRAIDQQARLAELDEDVGADDLTPRQILELLDDIVTVGRIAQAVQRAHPAWSTERVATFVDALDEGDVVMEGGEPDDDELGGDADPPAAAAPSAPSSSENGTETAPQSSSDSASGSSESATPPTSGTPTLVTSPEARSDPLP